MSSSLSPTQASALLSGVFGSLAGGVTTAAVALIVFIGEEPLSNAWPLWVYVVGLLTMAFALSVSSGGAPAPSSSRREPGSHNLAAVWAVIVAIMVVSLIAVGIIVPESTPRIVPFEYGLIVVGYLIIRSIYKPARESYSKRSVYAVALIIIPLVSASALVCPLIAGSPSASTNPVVLIAAGIATAAVPMAGWQRSARRAA